MKECLRRLTALTLAAALCMGALPAAAWATEDASVQEDTGSSASSAATGDWSECIAEPADDGLTSEQDAAGGAEEQETSEASGSDAGMDGEASEAQPEEDSAPVEPEDEAIPSEPEEEAAPSDPGEEAEPDCSAGEAEDGSLAAQAAGGGSSKSGLSWSLGGNGTLTVSGNGDMEDYDQITGSDYSPWKEYADSIRSIVIEDGVKSIGNQAFYNCKNATSVSIPSSVTRIGSYAFANTALTGIVIPGSVETIGSYAFMGCSNVTELTLSNGLKSIGEWAFVSCSITEVTIPASVEKMGVRVFFRCTKLSAIDVESGSPYFCSEDGVLFNRDKTVLVQCPQNKSEAVYVIPYGVEKLAHASLIGYSHLTSVTIPDTVKTIGDYALCSCEGLTSVDIPSSVTSIGDWAFGNNEQNKIQLKSINVDPDNSSYCSVDGVLFDKSKTNLIQYPPAKSGSSYSIPSGVRRIGYNAFDLCRNLTSITIPKSMNTIGGFAFSSCENLKKVTFKGGTPPSIDFSSFYQLSLSVYYPDSDRWKEEISDYHYYGEKKIKWVKTYAAPAAKLSSLTTPQKGWIKMAWKTVKGISGYEMGISETKTFKDGKHKVVRPSAKKKDATMSGFKSGKTYYVRIRTYKKGKSNDESVTYYGKWSAVKSVKVK